ncbi:hypothetical protein EDB84DRAFT_1570671 [Lactarius hengduanensis]|nr:hypothetical protein EDB84DRAFT_1570671 [Lactarius hengduanensis]
MPEDNSAMGARRANARTDNPGDIDDGDSGDLTTARDDGADDDNEEDNHSGDDNEDDHDSSGVDDDHGGGGDEDDGDGGEGDGGDVMQLYFIHNIILAKE